jgi:putative intracellular protease/amidase
VNEADYDAVFLPRRSRSTLGLATDKTSSALIELYTNNKPVAFVCHSPAVLKNVKVNGEF